MLIEIKNLKKYYPVQGGFLRKTQSLVKAVDGVDLFVREKENLGIVGESGCGKTTLVRVMAKLVPATSGEIVIGGKDVTTVSGRAYQPYRSSVQMVFQDPYSSLDPRFTVYKIIEEAFYNLPAMDRSKKESRVREILKAVQLPLDILNRFPHEFSGGERQRIAIARALVVSPRLLILDEAVSSLDVLVQKQILDLLETLQQQFNCTYVFISHNLRVVAKISDRIAVMFKGKIVELGPTQEILKNPLHPYTKSLLLAAIKYKSSLGNEDFSLASSAQIRDAGNGHFVLD